MTRLLTLAISHGNSKIPSSFFRYRSLAKFSSKYDGNLYQTRDKESHGAAKSFLGRSVDGIADAGKWSRLRSKQKSGDVSAQQDQKDGNGFRKPFARKGAYQTLRPPRVVAASLVDDEYNDPINDHEDEFAETVYKKISGPMFRISETDVDADIDLPDIIPFTISLQEKTCLNNTDFKLFLRELNKKYESISNLNTSSSHDGEVLLDDISCNKMIELQRGGYPPILLKAIYRGLRQRKLKQYLNKLKAKYNIPSNNLSLQDAFGDYWVSDKIMDEFAYLLPRAHENEDFDEDCQDQDSNLEAIVEDSIDMRQKVVDYNNQLNSFDFEALKENARPRPQVNPPKVRITIAPFNEEDDVEDEEEVDPDEEDDDGDEPPAADEEYILNCINSGSLTYLEEEKRAVISKGRFNGVDARLSSLNKLHAMPSTAGTGTDTVGGDLATIQGDEVAAVYDSDDDCSEDDIRFDIMEDANHDEIINHLFFDDDEDDDVDKYFDYAFLEAMKTKTGTFRDSVEHKVKAKLPRPRPLSQLIRSTKPYIPEAVPGTLAHTIGSQVWEILSRNVYYTEKDKEVMANRAVRRVNNIDKLEKKLDEMQASGEIDRIKADYETWPESEKEKYIFVSPFDKALDPNFRKGLAGIEDEERRLRKADGRALNTSTQGDTDWNVDAVVNEDDLDFNDGRDNSDSDVNDDSSDSDDEDKDKKDSDDEDEDSDDGSSDDEDSDDEGKSRRKKR